jgi:hypothetical protein
MEDHVRIALGSHQVRLLHRFGPLDSLKVC